METSSSTYLIISVCDKIEQTINDDSYNNCRKYLYELLGLLKKQEVDDESYSEVISMLTEIVQESENMGDSGSGSILSKLDGEIKLIIYRVKRMYLRSSNHQVNAESMQKTMDEIVESVEETDVNSNDLTRQLKYLEEELELLIQERDTYRKEAIHDLKSIQNHIEDQTKKLDTVGSTLTDLEKKLDEVELHDGPSEESMKKLDEVTGYEGRD